MPVNGFTVGRDVQLSVINAGTSLPLGLVTSFKKSQTSVDSMEMGLDGIPRPVRFLKGWSGSFNLDRMDATMDNYFAQIEANYFAGIPEGELTVTETITNPDGSISQFRFRQVLLKYDDGGDYEADKIVKQQVSFIAAFRQRLA